MAKAASKATALTTLVIGAVKVPVGLFSTRDKPGRLAEFTTAGPSGGVLKAEAVARPVPVDEAPAETVDRPVHSDPLAGKVIAEAIDGKRALDDDAVLDAMDASAERWSEEHATASEAAAAGDPLARELGAGPGVERDTFDDLPVAVDPEHPMGQRAIAEGERVDGEYGRQLVEDGTGQVVAPQDVRRGVRLEDGRFIDCTEQLAEIDAQTKLDQMEVIAFVDGTKVPRTRVQAAYYIGAGDEKAPRALRIMFEGLKRTRRMALVKLTKKSRQSLGVLGAAGGVLVLLELVWAEDFRPPPARATRIQKETVGEREVDMFCGLIDAMAAAPAVIDELRDDALDLREQLVKKALAGEVPEVLTPTPVAEAQDVLAQLEASLAAVSS